MRSSCVSVALIVLVLANPVCCQMFGAVPFAPANEQQGEQDDRCDCCRGESDRGETKQFPIKPCECPGGSFCQCLCAGAVVKESLEPEIDHDGLVQPIALELPVFSPQDSILSAHLAEFQGPQDGTNVGRATRCLFCSLLC